MSPSNLTLSLSLLVSGLACEDCDFAPVLPSRDETVSSSLVALQETTYFDIWRDWSFREMLSILERPWTLIVWMLKTVGVLNVGVFPIVVVTLLCDLGDEQE